MNDQNNGPLISVVVPIYKVELYLVECIESIIKQSYKNIEIILVDDGSPDRCPSICDAYKEKYDSVKVLHKPNGGLVSARIAGINIAQGEYITYVDGDDWVAEDHFEKIAKAIEDKQADIIVSDLTVFPETEKTPHTCVMNYGYYSKEDIVESILPVMLSKAPFYTFGIAPSICTKAFRKSLVMPIQNKVPLCIRLGEDAAVSYLAIEKANSLQVIEENGYMYRYNPRSMSRSYDNHFIENCIALLDHLNKNLESTLHYDVLLPQLQDYSCYMLLSACTNEFRGNQRIDELVSRLKQLTVYPLINSAVDRRNIPIKIKFLFNIIEREKYDLVFLLKQYLSIRNR